MRTVLSSLVETDVKGVWGEDLLDGQIGTPVIKTSNLNYDGSIDFDSLTYRYIDSRVKERNSLKTGDLLIEKSGGTKTHSVGYVAYYNGPDDAFVCNNFILVLRPNKAYVDSKYLFYQLKYMYESSLLADCYNKTTGIQNLKTRVYLSKPIKVPMIETQRQIANSLSVIQETIKSCKNQITLLDEQIKSLFNGMFKVDGFSTVPLKKVTSKITDGEHGTVPRVEENGCLYLMARNITMNGELDLSDISRIPEASFEKIYKRCNPEEGDILLVCVGATIGKLTVVPKMEKFALARSVALIKPNNGYLSPFIAAALRDDEVQAKMKEVSHAAAQPGLYTGMISELEIVDAPLERQKRFVVATEQIDKLRFNHLFFA